MSSHPNAELGEGTIIEDGATVGHPYSKTGGITKLGKNSIVRKGSIIYADVEFGDYFQTGHNAVVRAEVKGGHHCTAFHNVVIEGRITLGTGVRLMAGVYLPTTTTIGNDVFIGPGTTFLNDRLASRYTEMPPVDGPTVEDDVVIGGGCTILPGIRIGRGSFIAAGALVTKDIPPESFVIGHPCQIRELPEELRIPNCRALTRNKWDLFHPGNPNL
jgi:acetyltransferase-like isoleucine patch superfamily enzyme